MPNKLTHQLGEARSKKQKGVRDVVFGLKGAKYRRLGAKKRQENHGFGHPHPASLGKAGRGVPVERTGKAAGARVIPPRTYFRSYSEKSHGEGGKASSRNV